MKKLNSIVIGIMCINIQCFLQASYRNARNYWTASEKQSIASAIKKDRKDIDLLQANFKIGVKYQGETNSVMLEEHRDYRDILKNIRNTGVEVSEYIRSQQSPIVIIPCGTTTMTQSQIEAEKNNIKKEFYNNCDRLGKTEFNNREEAFAASTSVQDSAISLYKQGIISKTELAQFQRIVLASSDQIEERRAEISKNIVAAREKQELQEKFKSLCELLLASSFETPQEALHRQNEIRSHGEELVAQGILPQEELDDFNKIYMCEKHC